MTFAPSEVATSDVRSVDALSTTITSSTNSGMERRTFSIPCSSLRQGMIVVMDRPLYIGRPSVELQRYQPSIVRPRGKPAGMQPQTFSGVRALGYYGRYETLCPVPCLAGRPADGGRAFRGAERLPDADVPGARSVPGQSPYQRKSLPGGHGPEAGGCRVHRPHRPGFS